MLPNESYHTCSTFLDGMFPNWSFKIFTAHKYGENRRRVFGKKDN